MDRIITNTGGQPLLRRDIEYLQDSIEQMCTDIARLVCDGSSILSGCVITRKGTNISYTEGAICIEGKIYNVEAGTLTSSSSTLYWVVKYQDSDRRKFKNESEHYVYRKYTCTLMDNTSGAYKYVTNDDALSNFGRVLLNRFASLNVSTNMNGTFNEEEGWSGSAYRVPGIGGQRIFIYAEFTSSTETVSSLVVTLPSGTMKGRFCVRTALLLSEGTTASVVAYNKQSALDEVYVQSEFAETNLKTGELILIIDDIIHA